MNDFISFSYFFICWPESLAHLPPSPVPWKGSDTWSRDAHLEASPTARFPPPQASREHGPSTLQQLWARRLSSGPTR